MSIRNWVVSCFKLSHFHPNVLTFQALKALWTQEIAILILWKIVSQTEGHYFDHAVLTLESQSNRSCAEIYSVTEPRISPKLWLRNNTQFLALRNITHSIKILWNLYIFGTARAVTCNLIALTPEISVLHINYTSYKAKTKQRNMLCWIIFLIWTIWIIFLRAIMTKNVIYSFLSRLSMSTSTDSLSTIPRIF